MTRETIRQRYREFVLDQLDDAYTLAKWMAGNEADAAEVLQDAATNALDALETAPDELPRAWFLGLVRRSALNWIAGNRPKNLSLAEDWNDFTPSESGRTLDESAASAQFQHVIPSASPEKVRRAIAELPLPLREAVVMRDINGLAYKDIAKATSTTIGVVMHRITRARETIADRLEEAS